MYETMNNDTITVGAFSVRFLVEAADSNGSASVFECYVPANSRMPAPTATTASRRRSTDSRASRPGRSTARRSRSGPARRCACSAGDPRVRQPRRRRRDVPGDRDPRRLRARLLPRDRRGPRGQRRRPAGPGRDRRGDAPPRPHPRPAQRRLTERDRPPSLEQSGYAMPLQILTLKLDGITAGDYLTWCRDPEPARARLRAAVDLHRCRPARGHDHRDPRLEPSPPAAGRRQPPQPQDSRYRRRPDPPAGDNQRDPQS